MVAHFLISPAIATELSPVLGDLEIASPPDDSEPVTALTQLTDVQPNDWAFQALRSLVERYGCIVGYPDQTFRGDRALSRDEFAAGLNACLDRLQELLAIATADAVKTADWVVVRRLQEAFAAELATLRGRVTTLETRTATLEQHQFSPTTKIRAFSVFVVADTGGDFANNTRARDSQDTTQTFFSHYTRLNLLSSLTGKDLLTASLTASTVPLLAVATGTPMANFVTDVAVNPNNSALALDRLHYQFALGDRTTVWFGLRALQPYDFLPTVNPAIASLDGPTSRFSWYNPAVYRTGFESVGVGAAYKFNPKLQLHLAYLSGSLSANTPEVGFFQGNNSILAQLTFTPLPRFTAAIAYAHKYFRAGTVNLFGTTGSLFALQPFGQNPTTAENFGLQWHWRLAPRFSVGGWLGYTHATQVNASQRTATMLNGAVNWVAFDLLQRGDRGGFIVGVPPKVTQSNFLVRGVRREDPDTALHLEAFYTYRLNDNISVTPNLYVILNPNHDANNEPIWVGLIRTNFSF